MLFFIDNRQTCVYFDKGNFDKYCVYVNGRGRFRYAPTDDEYFNWILNLSKKYTVEQVWDDFCQVFNIVDTNENDNDVMNLIQKIDIHYDEDTIIWWILFYMTMLAECKKENAILKKRIKKLGVYNLLFDKYSIDYVTTYMRNQTWRDLDKLMKERGV